MSHIIKFLQDSSSQNLKKIQERLDDPELLLKTYISEFDMDSLEYLEFIMEIEDFCGINLNEQAVLKATTLSELDKLIEVAKA